MEPASITLHQDPRELTAKLVIDGAGTGILLGGNLDMIGMAVGWACPSFAGAILLIEDVDKYIGTDRQNNYSTSEIGMPQRCEGSGSGPVHSLGRRETRQVVGR
jgi:hypothetical protein